MHKPHILVRAVLAAAILGVAMTVGKAHGQTVVSTNQTAAQLSQLVGYTGKLAARLIIAEETVRAQQATLDNLHAYLRDMTCKHNKLVSAVADVAKATDATPVAVTVTFGKTCDGTAPSPQLPP